MMGLVYNCVLILANCRTYDDAKLCPNDFIIRVHVLEGSESCESSFTILLKYLSQLQKICLLWVFLHRI